MTTKTYDLEFLTPCFCAGADQRRAELRPSAIRGQLRWWFRALGGKLADETAVFGGVHAHQPVASSILVRVVNPPAGGEKDWFSDRKIPKQGMGNRTYLLGFFCGRTGRLDASAGALSPGSKARVSVVLRGSLPERLELAVQAFFSVGALGFRANRCAGAFTSKQHRLTVHAWTDLSTRLKAAGFGIGLLPQQFSDWVQLCEQTGGLLKHKLRGRDGLGISAGQNGTSANVLGSASPRQGSVVQLRPVRIDEKLRLALIEAPHERVLGQAARNAHRNRGRVVELAGLAQ